jgi:hypothetical protein
MRLSLRGVRNNQSEFMPCAGICDPLVLSPLAFNAFCPQNISGAREFKDDFNRSTPRVMLEF